MNLTVAVGAHQHALVKFGFASAVETAMPKHLGKRGILLGRIQMVETQRLGTSVVTTHDTFAPFVGKAKLSSFSCVLTVALGETFFTVCAESASVFAKVELVN